MATYEITAPNGKTYEIEGPEGASNDDVVAALLEVYPDAGGVSTAPTASPAPTTPTNQRSLGTRFGDAFDFGFFEESPMAALGRALGTYDPTLAEDGERLGDTTARGRRVTEASRGRRDAYQERHSLDPNIREGDSWYSPGSLARGAAEVIGGGIGNALGDPTSLINPGGSAVKQGLSQAAIGGGTDLGLQSVEALQGVRDELDLTRVAGTALVGGGLTYGVGKAVDKFGRRLDPEVEAEMATGKVDAVVDQTGAVTGTVMPDEVKAGLAGMIDNGATFQEIAEAFPYWVKQSPEAVRWWVAHRAEGGLEPIQFKAPQSAANDVSVQPGQAANDIHPSAGRPANDDEVLEAGFANDNGQRYTPPVIEDVVEVKAPVETPVEITPQSSIREADKELARVERLQPYVDEANAVTEGWTNRPEIQIHESAEELPALAGQGRTPKGMIDEDGVVHVFVDNLTDISELRPVVFHESLGHYGMTQKFGEGLDGILERFYNDAPVFRSQVDEWLDNNPNAYSGAPNRIARGADEVLAGLSEGGPLARSIIDKIKDYIKNFARSLGMKNVTYSDREIMSILAEAHGRVRSGERTDASTSGMRMSEQYGEPYVKKSLTAEKMRTARDLDDVLDLLGKEVEPNRVGRVSDAEVIAEMEAMGFSPSRVLRNKKSFRDMSLSGRIAGAKQALTNIVEDLGGLRERALQEGLSPVLRRDIAEKLQLAKLIYARLDEDSAELGRALRQLRKTTESRRQQKALARMSEDDFGLSELADDATMMKFLDNLDVAQKVQGPEAAMKALKRVNEKHWEDYVGSVLFNFMLSSPVTFAKNAVGSPMNFMRDVVVDGVAATGGQVARAWKGDRVYGREVAYRTYGALQALWNFDTYKKTFDAFVTGEGSTRNIANKTGRDRMVFEGAAASLETPSRALAAMDEFWSNILFMGNLYGEAARGAAAKSGDFKTNVDAFINEPTPDMLKRAQFITEQQLFRDNTSKAGQLLQDLTTPRYADETVLTQKMGADGTMKFSSQVSKSADSQAVRVAKFTGKVLVPFVGTLDSIARTTIRNSGPASLLSKEIRDQLMAGGAQRQSAIARIAVSSAALAYFGTLAAEGKITGPEDANYKKEAGLKSVEPPMSIKVGNEWVSYAGYDPASAYLAIAAGTFGRYKKEELTDNEYINDAASGLSSFASALMESSFAGSLADALSLAQEGIDLVKGGATKGTALKNTAAGLGATLMTPAAVRWGTQEFLDPMQRDSSGDGTLGGMLQGRVSAALPGLSETLPVRHDVFGRETENVRQERMVEEDPYVLEVNRLEKGQEGVVLGMPDKTIYKSDKENKRLLTSEEFQEYARISGEIIYEELQVEMDTEEWDLLTDEQKIKVIKDVAEDVRKEVRETLFPKQSGETE